MCELQNLICLMPISKDTLTLLSKRFVNSTLATFLNKNFETFTLYKFQICKCTHLKCKNKNKFSTRVRNVILLNVPKFGVSSVLRSIWLINYEAVTTIK